MNTEMKAKLQKLASRKCWSDDEDFVVDDYAAGNLDDAYYGGVDDGIAGLARELLAEFDEASKLEAECTGNDLEVNRP